MNQYLAERLACNTGFVLGESNERLPFIIELLGEQLHDIYMEQKTIDQFGVMLLQLEKDSERKKIINETKSQMDQLYRKRINKAMKRGQDIL